MDISAVQSQYGATFTPPPTSNPYQSVADKYGATYTPPSSPSTLSKVGNFLGISNLPTYIPDSIDQAKNAVMHPIQTLQKVGGAAYGAVDSAFNVFKPENIDELKPENAGKTGLQISMQKSPAQNVADVANTVSSIANTFFSPVTVAFAAAKEVPVLKQAADVLQSPFSVTGKLGDFAAEKFIDVLPIDQQSKDILKPAFGQLGALAAQILLGGKVMDLAGKGYKAFTKTKVDELVNETSAQSEQFKQQVVNHPQVVAEKYGATFTSAQEPKIVDSSNGTQEPLNNVKPDQTAFDSEGFRPVQKGEVLPSGDYTTKMNMTTGEQMTNAPIKGDTNPVLEPISEPSNSTDIKTSPLDQNVETKVSKLSSDIADSLKQDYAGLPEYNTMNMKEQAGRAVDLAKNDPELFHDVAMGKKAAPDGLREGSVFVAARKMAEAMPDPVERGKALLDLAHSKLSSHAAELGQEIKAFDDMTRSENPIKTIKEIEKVRGESKKINKEAKKDKIEIKNEIKKTAPKKGDWSSFIESIKC